MEYMKIILLSIFVSYITTKIIAVHYFKIIDSYVEKIIQQLIEIVEESKQHFIFLCWLMNELCV